MVFLDDISYVMQGQNITFISPNHSSHKVDDFEIIISKVKWFKYRKYQCLYQLSSLFDSILKSNKV